MAAPRRAAWVRTNPGHVRIAPISPFEAVDCGSVSSTATFRPAKNTAMANVRESVVAAFNDHVMLVGLAGGTLQYRDQELTLQRNGMPEQVWMNLDYMPVLNEHGEPVGVMAIVLESTDPVLAERRVEANLMVERSKASCANISSPSCDTMYVIRCKGFLPLANSHHRHRTL